jgi:mitogen-activated protein kinase 1/3
MNGKILFPGQHYIEPDDDAKKYISNEYALKYIESLPKKSKVNLQELFPTMPAEALDLLDKMLDMNP